MNITKLPFLFLIILHLNAAAQEILTIEDAVKITVKNNYQIITAANNLKIDCIFISEGVHRKEFSNFSELNKLLENYDVKANFFQKELQW